MLSKKSRSAARAVPPRDATPRSAAAASRNVIAAAATPAASTVSRTLWRGSDFADEREQPLVQDAVRRDHPGAERRRLVEDERPALEVGRAAARLLDEQRPGADVPLVLRCEREGGIAGAARDLGELECDAARQLHVHARLERVPFAALVLGAAGEHLGIGHARRPAHARAFAV